MEYFVIYSEATCFSSGEKKELEDHVYFGFSLILKLNKLPQKVFAAFNLLLA